VAVRGTSSGSRQVTIRHPRCNRKPILIETEIDSAPVFFLVEGDALMVNILGQPSARYDSVPQFVGEGARMLLQFKAGLRDSQRRTGCGEVSLISTLRTGENAVLDGSGSDAISTMWPAALLSPRAFFCEQQLGRVAQGEAYLGIAPPQLERRRVRPSRLDSEKRPSSAFTAGQRGATGSRSHSEMPASLGDHQNLLPSCGAYPLPGPSP
jgi:hypothetical protein